MIVFVVSLTQDGYYIDGPDPKAWAPGWGLLVFGWTGIFVGELTWLANPVLVAGWILVFLDRKKVAVWCASVSLVVMVSFLFRRTVISSEAPTYSKIVSYQAGYWLWLSSAVLILAGALSVSAKKRKSNQTPLPTPASVTPAADAPVAPPPGAAGL